MIYNFQLNWNSFEGARALPPAAAIVGGPTVLLQFFILTNHSFWKKIESNNELNEGQLLDCILPIASSSNNDKLN